MTDSTPAPLTRIIHEFTAFLRRPRRYEPTGLRAPGALRHWAVLSALMIGVMLGLLLPFLRFWQDAFDLPAPDAFGKIAPHLMVPTVLLVAPVLEELLFRGWLTGRVRALWLLACAVAFIVLLYASAQGLNPVAVGACLLALLLAAPIGWLVLRKRMTPGWFDAAFPAIFYLPVVGFAALHLMNYPSFSALALPLVLPQLWVALVLGFMRLRIGLMAAILTHILSNAAALGVATLAG